MPDALEPIYQLVGSRVASERKKRGLTQHQLSAGMDLTRASLGNIEIGRQRIQLHTLMQIAERLGMNYLLFLQPDEDVFRAE